MPEPSIEENIERARMGNILRIIRGLKHYTVYLATVTTGYLWGSIRFWLFAMSYASTRSLVHLTPLIPLSKQRGKTIVISQYVWRGGELFERGRSPLYLLFPSPARKSLASYRGTGLRGVKGEVEPSTRGR
jgi:hypothetical protein